MGLQATGRKDFKEDLGWRQTFPSAGIFGADIHEMILDVPHHRFGDARVGHSIEPLLQ